ncbi:MAPEG family protein [Dyella sp.]|uniref:MAPEG family protein n=1 Tax=Dyella sp. TaxID=1869338 RepID=UPI002ED06A9D
MLQNLPALVTLLNVLLQFFTLYLVGNARKRYDVKAPAISGHEGFERAWRVQMNTLEGTVMFLPVLWLATMYGFPGLAGIAGLVWLAGRLWYITTYLKDPASRGPAFMISLAAWAALVVLAGFGIVRAMFLI